MWLDILCICVLPSSSLIFYLFIYYFFFFEALVTLFCIDVFWRRGTRGGHMFDFDWIGGLVSGGNLFSFPHFSRQKRSLDINFSFLFLFPTCYSVTFLLRVLSPITCIAHFALCFLSFLLILRYVPYLNFISFLIFCLFEFLFSFFSAFPFGK